MTKREALDRISYLQEYYINKLVKLLENSECAYMKECYFTSDTGTGKTRMIAKLCNKMPDAFFIITTLSRGQLNRQVKYELQKHIKQDNYLVYGLCDYKTNSKLQAEDILSLCPKDKSLIWIRDEGHINTNKWQTLLANRCWKIVNVSATNNIKGGAEIRCNFSDTMMLRTVNQQVGTPEDAINRLILVKNAHKDVQNYNPCAIFRCVDNAIADKVIEICKRKKLKYINITEESFDMSDLCKDDNPYDVIINKFKIVEGIDIRRAHVLYMDNEPSNVATTIQVIGRCRRNALLYRDDVDIFSNRKLLEATRECYVFYNVTTMKVDQDTDGNLVCAFCNKISCEKLRAGSTIHVENGVLDNGLTVIELEGQTGDFDIVEDKGTGFNVIAQNIPFYEFVKKEMEVEPTLYGLTEEEIRKKLQEEVEFNYSLGEYEVVRFADIPIIKVSEKKVLFEDMLRKYGCKDGCIETEQIPYLFSHVYDRKLKKYGLTVNPYTPTEECSLEVTRIDDGRYECRMHVDAPDATSEASYTRWFGSKEERKKYEDKMSHPITVSKKVVSVIIYNDYESSDILPEYRNTYLAEYSSGRMVLSANEAITIRLKKYTGRYKKLYEGDIYKYFSTFAKSYAPYTKICNDKQSAIIGVDTMKSIDSGNNERVWVESRAVTDKVSKYSKLSIFIEREYGEELATAKQQLFNGKNKFTFDTRCNSRLGYCAEYYAKYLVYGEGFLKGFIDKALKESRTADVNPYIIIRACMLMYKEDMVKAFGAGCNKIINAMSIETLVQQKYKNFVEKVIELGTNIAEFVRSEFGFNTIDDATKTLYDPNLSIKHIAALADFITKDKIIDVKCTSKITNEYIKQVLAYHYLSTKRSDLDVKEVIVFDAVTCRYVRVKIHSNHQN